MDLTVDEKYLENYIQRLPERVGEHNANLIINYLNKYQGLPSAPGTKRLSLVAMRLKAISKMLNHKPLDSLTENDFINLNLAMRKKGMLSAQDYRKILKQFLDIEIKPKLQTIEQKYNLGELMKSRYLKAPQQKNVDRKPLVDPETFWNKQEIERYLISSQEHSLRQSAWAGLWLSSGCRPHELLSLIKKDISFDGTYLTITIQQGKTGKRQIKLNGNYGKVLYFLI